MEIDTERLKDEFQAIGEEYNFDQTKLNRTLDLESNALGIHWGYKLLLVFSSLCAPQANRRKDVEIEGS